MLRVVTGGSGSGKSEYAERLVTELCDSIGVTELIYIATMKPYGEEGLARIERHRKMRSGKGFETYECYGNLSSLSVKSGSVALLECMSNLAANEMFDNNNKNMVSDIMDGLALLCEKCAAVVVVTNEIFSDGADYDDETVRYIKTLGEINRRMAEMAESVTEVVCGIPIRIKGGE